MITCIAREAHHTRPTRLVSDIKHVPCVTFPAGTNCGRHCAEWVNMQRAHVGGVNLHYNNEWGDTMNTMKIKIYKKNTKPCKHCLVVSRKGVVELHLYSSIHRYVNAELHYLDAGYAVYCYHVLYTGALWYVSAHTMHQPFEMALSKLTGLVVF